MIPKFLLAIWAATAPAIGNHLWQSTLCLGIAGLLTLVLHKNRARYRYGLWLAASIKFLIPFSLLITFGIHLARLRALPPVAPGFYLAMEQVSQPFTRPAAAASPVAPTSMLSSLVHLLPPFLVAMWFCGFVVVLFVWYSHWRRVSAALRDAVPSREGRELDALRRVERLIGIRKPLDLLLSPTTLEPGIFGIVRPTLVWPKGISARLDNAQLEAILAHELWHIRRRDNLAAAIHMVVEALFWFHPLVWWLGSRLVEERERACDEEVLELGSDRQVYAQSILKTCEFCVESPLACVSGVTSSDLKKRIVRIMTERARLKLDFRRKLILGVAGFLAIAVPVGLGLAHGQEGQANGPQSGDKSQAAEVLTGAKFEVASIKQDKSGGNLMSLPDMTNDGGFYVTNAPVKTLLRLAYGVQDFQITEGPSWIDSDRFDIQAKADSSADDVLKKLSRDQIKLVNERMAQELLADRFRLKLRRGTRQLPVYALVIAKDGPKFQESKDSGSGPQQPSFRVGPAGGLVRVSSHEPPPALTALTKIDSHDEPMSVLAQALSWLQGRVVVDKTGLNGKYNYTLKWLPDGMLPGLQHIGHAGPPPGISPAPNSTGPSIFTAIQEQLGLKLESTTGPVEVLVIDHIERPSEN